MILLDLRKHISVENAWWSAMEIGSKHIVESGFYTKLASNKSFEESKRKVVALSHVE